MKDRYNITVVGAGYVGLGNALLFADRHDVTVTDIDEARLRQIEAGISPVRDEMIEERLGHKRLRAVYEARGAYKSCDFAMICVPTDFDEEKQSFDTSAVLQTAEAVFSANPAAVIVIRSTVPIGFTKKLSERYGEGRVLFSPEFLREGHALYDNLHPGRIVVGHGESAESAAAAGVFAKMLSDGACEEVPVLYAGYSEAEAIKIFSNAYLASRIAFFNELDMFAEQNGLSTAQIIEGMGYDARIGSTYNNPSFGYGGYCLPKDTRQLLSQFGELPQSMIGAAVRSNSDRAEYIADRIIGLASERSHAAPRIGIYRMVMKSGSDNFRSSAVLNVMRILEAKGAETVIYEPLITENEYRGHRVIAELDAFFGMCDIVVANRSSAELAPAAGKVYTRDIFFKD